MTEIAIPATGTAAVPVRYEGYAGLGGDAGRVSGTVTMTIDGDAAVVIDPGIVAGRGATSASVIITGHGVRSETHA